jgi:hypothetical protein
MVEIKIDNQSLDLFGEEVISFTFAINDLASIESRNGSYSNQFNIPATANNSAILGYPDKLNFVTGFSPSRARNARILIDGLEVQRGSIQIEQYDDTSKEFSISFFSGNSEWIGDISDLSIRDLDLSVWDHQYTLANISGSFNNTEGYIYPFINYGRLSLIAGNGTEYFDWKPAMYSHTILKQIFIDANWKVEGNLFNDPFFLKHLTLYNKQTRLSEEAINGLGFASTSAGGFATPGATPIVFDTVTEGNNFGSYDNTTGVYTASETFRANIISNINTAIAGDLQEIRRNGSVISSIPTGITRDQVLEATILAGDQITITTNVAASLNPTTQRFQIQPLDEISEGMTFRMNEVLDDISQEEYVKDIFNQFGAVFSTDPISRTVYINKFETIRDNIPNAIDWTSKLDLSRDITTDFTELVSDYGRKNFFRYTQNNDREDAQGKLRTRTNIGDGSFNIDNDFITKEETIFESVFSSSANYLAFNGRTILMYLPIYDDTADDVEDRELTPRIGVNAGVIPVSDLFTDGTLQINIVGQVSNVLVNEVPYVYFHLEQTGVDAIDNIKQGLSFGNPIFPVWQNNLLDTYYEDYKKILNNPRKLTAYFLLNERDINDIDYLVPRYLGGELNSYFYINQIKDYRPNEAGVSEVELILI